MSKQLRLDEETLRQEPAVTGSTARVNEEPVPTEPSATSRPPSLHQAVFSNLEKYFRDLEGTRPSCIYEMVIQAVERPMLEVVMREAQGNQLRASEMLGINRNTLRKKLQHHGML